MQDYNRDAHGCFVIKKMSKTNDSKQIVSCLWTFLFVALFYCSNSEAQNSMRIHQTDGAHLDVPIEKIDSVTFVDSAIDSIL